VRAKVRCDIQSGKCARCKTKGIQCEWPTRTGYLTKPQSEPLNPEALEPRTASTALMKGTFLPNFEEQDHQLNYGAAGGSFSNTYGTDIEPSWGGRDPLRAFTHADSVNPMFDLPLNPHNKKRHDLQIISARLAEYGAPYSSFRFIGNSIPDLPQIPQQISTRNQLRAFQCRKFANPAQIHSATILSRLISSYPTMMLRRETFPPFIHPQCVPVNEIDPPLLRPLAKCMELARAFKYRTLENSEMIWKEIRVEHERLCNEVCIPKLLLNCCLGELTY
jgi:hypothetical protein